ncbi:MAG: permease-like cell division protein FtsX, partial [Synergistaceae bacterium]|nr:permease-like cell division protein FtsX [Synergistaceae bacterium]
MAAVRYACRDGWRLIVRHWGMSLLTIFTAMSVFFIIGASTLFVLNVRNIVSSLENQMTIQAYLKPKADVKAAEKAIKALPYVKETKLITRDMALERLRSRIGEQAKAVMLLGENPLPESIEIKVRKASDVAETARLLVAVPEIEDIVYAGRVAEKLTRVSGFVEKFSIVMLLVAIAASGVVLFNTIRISVYSREEEIGVMMMVGATSTYVTLP